MRRLSKKTLFRSVHCLNFVAFLQLSMTLLSVLKTRRHTHTQVHSVTAITIKPFCINRGSKCGGFWALPQLWWQQKQREAVGAGLCEAGRKTESWVLPRVACKCLPSPSRGQNQSYYSFIDSSVRRQCGLVARIPCELISCSKTLAHKKISW